MDATQSTSNIHEQAARERKVAALVLAAERTRTVPIEDLYEFWMDASGYEFAALVAEAGIKPPSGATITAFFHALQARAGAQ